MRGHADVFQLQVQVLPDSSRRRRSEVEHSAASDSDDPGPHQEGALRTGQAVLHRSWFIRAGWTRRAAWRSVGTTDVAAERHTDVAKLTMSLPSALSPGSCLTLGPESCWSCTATQRVPVEQRDMVGVVNGLPTVVRYARSEFTSTGFVK